MGYSNMHRLLISVESTEMSVKFNHLSTYCSRNPTPRIGFRGLFFELEMTQLEGQGRQIDMK